MTEDALEQLAITWFQDAGWTFRRGPDIAPDSSAPARSDWRQRESIRARLRNLVHITLRRHKYLPDLQEAAIKLVLNQAQRLADDWGT